MNIKNNLKLISFLAGYFLSMEFLYLLLDKGEDSFDVFGFLSFPFTAPLIGSLFAIFTPIVFVYFLIPITLISFLILLDKKYFKIGLKIKIILYYGVLLPMILMGPFFYMMLT